MRICKCKSRRKARKSSSDQKGLVSVLLGGAILLLLTSCYLWILGGKTPPSISGIGGSFQLTAMNGDTVTDRNFLGHPLLIYFGYTNCQDVCPTTLSTVSRALTDLGPKAVNVQPIFITVDPVHDTPEILRSFVSAFSPRIIGLTGSVAQIQAVQQEYHVDKIVHPHGPGLSGYDIDHSSVLFVIGADGRYLAPIRADENAAEMAADIAKYLS